MSASIETTAVEFEQQALIGKVDVDVNLGLTAKFGVRNMPTVLYLKNGEVLDKQIGATSKMVLKEKLKAIL